MVALFKVSQNRPCTAGVLIPQELTVLQKKEEKIEARVDQLETEQNDSIHAQALNSRFIRLSCPQTSTVTLCAKEMCVRSEGRDETIEKESAYYFELRQIFI
jgi:hypothetical protein